MEKGKELESIRVAKEIYSKIVKIENKIYAYNNYANQFDKNKETELVKLTAQLMILHDLYENLYMGGKKDLNFNLHSTIRHKMEKHIKGE